MIKKALILLIALLPLSVVAQQAVGSWYLYPLYNGVPTRVVDTPSHAYYLSLGRLYGYDKDNDESRSYAELLNDTGISKIDYNPEKKFLFVGYENGNIDLLYDNGRVVNLPDIKEAQIAYDKSINEVDFIGGHIFVATAFGLVEFDSDKGVVLQSGIYGVPVKAVGSFGNYLLINVDSKNYVLDRSKLLSRFENFTYMSDHYNVEEFKRMGDFVLARTNNSLWAINYNVPEAKMNVIGTQTSGACSPVMRGADGKMRVVNGGKLYAYDAKGDRTEEASVPSTLNNNAYGTCRGASSLWAANADGLGCYNISGSTLTVKNDRMLPAGAISIAKVGLLKASADGSHLYVGSNGSIYTGNPGTVSGAYLDLSLIASDGVSNVTPLVNNAKIRYPDDIAVSPDDPEKLFIATDGSGIHVVKNKQSIANFNTSNSPMGLARSNGLAFDPNGNLWVSSVAYEPTISILPANKLQGNLSDIKKNDWIVPSDIGFKGNGECKFIFIPGTNLVYIKCAVWGQGIRIYDTKGTLSNTSDDTYKALTSLIDQDGKSYSSPYYMEMVMDNTGAIWVGTGTGIFIINNPQDGMSPDFRITRPKVARNDGTNFADYLLDGEFITAIAVDGSNNKWIGTKASGLYYVNADGSEVLAHYTTENSALSDNVITRVYADPNSNNVYVGTNFGLLRYSGFHSPGQESYDEVYAYPNPVRPGYTGWITVTGLMDNSLVKIADSSGNVLYQGRSDGGMFTWDGCNNNGARVKSGVYYVFASQNENGSSSAAVTKILIMN